MYRWPSAKVCAGGRGFMQVSGSKVVKVATSTRARESRRANSVREPSVKERLIGRAPLGKAQVAFALKRFERAKQHGLVAAAAPQLEEAVERRQRHGADAAVGHKIGIVLAVAVESGERALKE